MSDSFATPWTVARQVPVFMGFLKQEYWSKLPFPSPGDLPDPGIKPMSPALQVDSLPLSHQDIKHCKTANLNCKTPTLTIEKYIQV